MDRREPLDPEEAFGLLSDGTRMAILHAVWAAPETPIPFSELRERVGRPDSGRFNYHLDRLRGHYLARSDDGYELTQAGREVVRAVLAGTLTDRPVVEPAPIDAPCPHCGGDLVARFDDRGHIECADCGTTVMWNEFPPAGLEGRSVEGLARAFDRWTQRRFRLAMDGVCPSCSAPMEDLREGSVDGGDLATRHRCPNCRYEARVPLVGHLIDHPAVVSFFHERGVDITGEPYWALQSMARSFTLRLVGDDPWRVEVGIEADGDRLAVTLDERLDVVDVS